MIILGANYDAPFSVKNSSLQKVFEAAILYGCEAWLKVSLRSVETLHDPGESFVWSEDLHAQTDFCIRRRASISVCFSETKQAKFLQYVR